MNFLNVFLRVLHVFASKVLPLVTFLLWSGGHGFIVPGRRAALMGLTPALLHLGTIYFLGLSLHFRVFVTFTMFLHPLLVQFHGREAPKA